MPKVSPLKPNEVIHKLRQLGFEGPISGGRHMRMIRREPGQVIPIPMHKGKDVSVGVIRSIIREVGISPEEWNKL